MRPYIHKTVLGCVVALGLTGCVDMQPGDTEDTEYDSQQQAVVVVPEFTITGSDAIPPSLYLSQMDLAVSEIRLEPISGDLAYSTRDAMIVSFDLAEGEDIRTHEPIELPDAGSYLVSIRLEPVAPDEDSAPRSFSMSGFVAENEGSETIDEGDGTPFPMPFDEAESRPSDDFADRPGYPVEWTPFQYKSMRAVFYTFDDVHFDSGEQFLTFTFDVRDWGLEVVDPISKAVRNSHVGDDEGVDVTKQVDSTGSGVDALIETGVVATDRRPHP